MLWLLPFCSGHLQETLQTWGREEGAGSWSRDAVDLSQLRFDPGRASLGLSGLFTSAGCCRDWRREIASSGYVVGLGKGFSTAFVMFKGGCCSQIKLE